ncbi:MAG TPA: hypothetical protein VE988_12790 [Gemmataceae bacterium]|nr:hypothetical protein [Gemmataceae bacterium]
MWIIIGVLGGVLLLGGCCVGVPVAFFYFSVQKVNVAKDRFERSFDLRQLGEAMHQFHGQNKRMPANLDDLKPFLAGSKVEDRVRNGEIEVVWNSASFNDEDRGTDKVIIAWDVQTVRNGERVVLFMNKSVQTITEEQFQNTPKARKVGEKKQNKK